MNTETIAVEQYFPLVKAIAWRISRRLPSHIELDDLEQSGMVGLLEAAGRYKPSFGVKFVSYATRRIVGAILDHLRGEDPCARNTRTLGKRVEAVREQMAQSLGRQPESDEIARGAGISLKEFHHVSCRLESALPAVELRDDDETQILVENLPAPEKMEPECGEYQVERYLRPLKPRLKAVVLMRYMEDMGLKEIGAVLGVGPARASQLLRQAIVQIRHCMEPRVNLYR